MSGVDTRHIPRDSLFLMANVRVAGREVQGAVAWVQDKRFGIAFSDEIDPKVARAPVGQGDQRSPRYTRPAAIAPEDAGGDPSRLRKL